MKKLIITIAALFAFTALSAQQVNPKKIKNPESPVKKVKPSSTNGSKAYQWINPVSSLLDDFYGTTNAVEQVNPLLLVDSTMVYLSDNGKTHVFIHNYGVTLDPYSDVHNNSLSLSQSYTLDSLMIGGFYFIADGSYTDTLIVEIVHNQPETEPSFYPGIHIPPSATGPTDTIFFSPAKMMGSTKLKGWESKLTDPNKTVVKRPLTTSDSATSSFGIDVPNIQMTPGEIVGVSITFKPGYSYSFGDTLFDFPNTSPMKNTFLPLGYQVKDDQANPYYFKDPFNDLGRYNEYTVVLSEGRYGMYQSQWRNETMAPMVTLGWNVGFKIEGYQSIDENSNLSMDIYPNPVVNQVNINVQDYRDATMEIYDLQGKVVKSQELSSERSNVDVSGLEDGTYLVRVINGEKVATKKIIINK